MSIDLSGANSFLGLGKMGKANVDKEYPYGSNAPRPDLKGFLTKSWMFELRDRKTQKTLYSYTLVLPPQSISIKEPQRVSITKTFGNSFVDDYGMDNIQITIKGISGTAHAFPTMSIEEGTSKVGYNAPDAFYKFRDNIIRFKESADWDQWELRVYDLADEQSYLCVLLDFTLDRSAESPLHYPFSISLFVYESLSTYKYKLKPIVISKYPKGALDNINKLLNLMKKLNQGFQSITNAISMVNAKALELRARWDKALDTTTNILVSPLDLAHNLVDAAFTLLAIIPDTYDAVVYVSERYVDKKLGALEFARTILNESLRIYGYQISEGWQSIKSLSFDIDAGMEVNDAEAASSSSTSGVARASVASSYAFSGLNVYTIKGNDTLPGIALNELGNSDLWPYIANVNPGITNSSDLVSGETLFIPVKNSSVVSSSKEQFIFSEDVTRDPYGSDMQIDTTGNLVFVGGEAATISGIENVKQAINMQLNTEVGSMIKQAGFGMVAQAGFAGTSMALSYIKMAVQSSIMKDPRVEAVNNIVVNLESDSVFLSMDIKLVGSETSLSVPITI